MQKKIFTVYDSKSETYTPPMLHNQAGEATRAFEGEVNNPQSMLNKYPADFTLFEIGVFDLTTGELFSYEAKKNLGTGNEFVKIEKAA